VKPTHLIAILIAGFLAAASLHAQTPNYDANWPQWRGPLGTGVAPSGNPPVKWDENTNIKWKVHVPATAPRRRSSGATNSSFKPPCQPRANPTQHQPEA